tara:strand:- start:287 stop:496 length:210 start_codon:yes stop_codon:yes gene_type:complete
MSDYRRGDWKFHYHHIEEALGAGLSKDQKKMLRVLFMKAEDQILGLRKGKKGVAERMRETQLSRRGSFH